MEEKKKIVIDKSKLLTNVISGSIVTCITAVVVVLLIYVFKDDISLKKSENIDESSIDAQMERIKEAFEMLSDEYIDGVDISTIADGAISGMASATGDPYTRFVSEDEYQEMLVSGTEEYGGIGVHITYDEDSDGIIVLAVMPGSPAEDSDIKPGDIIIKVDDLDVTYDTYQKAVDDIKGEQGTTVNIKLLRDKEVIEKTVERAKIQVNNVSSEVIDNIGYIKILSFDNDIANQFKEQYDALRNQNIKGLVIDLRNNPGGLVSETVKIANMLLPKGEIVKLVYNDGREKLYNSDGKSTIDIPLVVLVNGRSASASEILSSAIKDTNTGTLVGTKTYGKGIVQTIEDLTGNGALSITTAKYYTISGVEIHKNGIEPNEVVELPDDVSNDTVVDRDKDTQLQRALEIINSKVK